MTAPVVLDRAATRRLLLPRMATGLTELEDVGPAQACGDRCAAVRQRLHNRGLQKERL